MTIKFTPNAPEYTKTIGHLCPDKYSYEPSRGDVVDLGLTLHGILIPSGKVVKKTKVPKEVQAVLAEYEESYCVTEQMLEVLKRHYIYYGDEYTMYSAAGSVWVLYVDPDFVCTKKILKALPEACVQKLEDQSVTTIKLEEPLYKMTWQRQVNGSFLFKCTMRVLIDAPCVSQTKAMQEFEHQIQSSPDVENVAYSKDAVPLSLWRRLNEQVDALCKEQRVHYHPGSKKTLRDIVHPSLYPFIKGVSKANPTDSKPFKRGSQTGATDRYGNAVDFWGRPYEDSVYQWLPANFEVTDKGKVSISSYINNLDAQRYAPMYRTIEQVFEHLLPSMQMVASNLRNDFYPLEDAKEAGVAKKICLSGRTLQVVCKIVQYEVSQEVNFDGIWHVEGMSHENVLLTGLCVFDRTPNFKGANIEFKRYLFEQEATDLIYNTPQNARRPTQQLDGGDVRPLGSLPTPFGSTIVFPNSHIHRVSTMSSSNDKLARRRILVFWVVNPNTPIVGSHQIAPQQQSISWQSAKVHQKELMKERSVHKASFEDREVFLCEH